MNYIIRIILLVTLFFFSHHLKSQQNNILNDEFDNNIQNWTIASNSSHRFEIINSTYLIEGKLEGRAITTTISIDTNLSNFKIFSEFMKLKGIDNNGYGLIWGGYDENNEFEFIISGNGQFKIIEWNNGKQNVIVPWSNSASINKWNLATNILSIECKENLWKFYINDNYVARCKAQAFFGNKFGFIVNENISCQANYLKIKNLDLIEHKRVSNRNSIINPEIIDVSFVSKRGNDKIHYGESAVLKLKVQNLNSFDLKDINLKIEPISSVDGLLFDDIVIIDKINANDTKLISILITANDEVETNDRKLMLKMYNLDNKLMASQEVSFKSVGYDVYHEQTKKYSNKNHPYYNKYKKTSNNNASGCLKGCSFTSLLILLLGMVIVIL